MIMIVLASLCDKSGSMMIFLFLKILIGTICVCLPLIIIFKAVATLTSYIINGKDFKEQIGSIIKSIVAGLIVFLIPEFLNFTFTKLVQADYGSITTCYSTASLEKVNSLRAKEAEEKKRLKEEEAKKAKQDLEEYEKDQAAKNAATKALIEKYKQMYPSVYSGAAGKAHSVSDKTDYMNSTLNVTKVVDTNINNPSSGLGDGRNKYRAVQTAAYTGKYIVYAQNKNYGSIESSSKGGRICWADAQTGEQVKCVEVGEEGGHMDGLAYDNDRGYVLKTASGNRLMQYDNRTMEFKGYVSVPSTHTGITYVPSTGCLVGESDGKFYFYKYNKNTNAYETDHVVTLQNFDANAVQGIGTDGTNIFIADSSPWDSKRNLYTYSLDGRKLEVHDFGSGFGSMSDEVESAFGDNNGNLYLACPQGIGRVDNYRANKIGLP